MSKYKKKGILSHHLEVEALGYIAIKGGGNGNDLVKYAVKKDLRRFARIWGYSYETIADNANNHAFGVTSPKSDFIMWKLKKIIKDNLAAYWDMVDYSNFKEGFITITTK